MWEEERTLRAQGSSGRSGSAECSWPPECSVTATTGWEPCGDLTGAPAPGPGSGSVFDTPLPSAWQHGASARLRSTEVETGSEGLI